MHLIQFPNFPAPQGCKPEHAARCCALGELFLAVIAALPPDTFNSVGEARLDPSRPRPTVRLSKCTKRPLFEDGEVVAVLDTTVRPTPEIHIRITAPTIRGAAVAWKLNTHEEHALYAHNWSDYKNQLPYSPSHHLERLVRCLAYHFEEAIRLIRKEHMTNFNPNTFQPISDYVLVKRDSKDLQTASGLHIPEIAKGKQNTGTVVKVGPGELLDSGVRHPVDVKPGDRISWGQFRGEDPTSYLTWRGESYVILGSDDIQGILDETP